MTRGSHPVRACCAIAIATVVGALASAGHAWAADYRSTAEPVTVLYDAPSAKAKPLYLLSRDMPLEVIVAVEGWTKVRDAGGTIGWVERRALTDKRSIIVRTPIADIRSTPDENAPIVFRAEQNVMLEMAESATSPATTAAPGWLKVRHRDGQTGFVRLGQVFGF